MKHRENKRFSSPEFFNWYVEEAAGMTNEQIEKALETNVSLGFMEHAGVNEEGEPLYTMTEAGNAKVEELLATLLKKP